MAMMYNLIAQALEKAGLSSAYHPQDYLSFYCLGNRERLSPGASELEQPTDNNGLVRKMIKLCCPDRLFSVESYCIARKRGISCISIGGSLFYHHHQMLSNQCKTIWRPYFAFSLSLSLITALSYEAPEVYDLRSRQRDDS